MAVVLLETWTEARMRKRPRRGGEGFAPALGLANASRPDRPAVDVWCLTCLIIKRNQSGAACPCQPCRRSCISQRFAVNDEGFHTPGPKGLVTVCRVLVRVVDEQVTRG